MKRKKLGRWFKTSEDEVNKWSAEHIGIEIHGRASRIFRTTVMIFLYGFLILCCILYGVAWHLSSVMTAEQNAEALDALSWIIESVPRVAVDYSRRLEVRGETDAMRVLLFEAGLLSIFAAILAIETVVAAYVVASGSVIGNVWNPKFNRLAIIYTVFFVLVALYLMAVMGDYRNPAHSSRRALPDNDFVLIILSVSVNYISMGGTHLMLYSFSIVRNVVARSVGGRR